MRAPVLKFLAWSGTIFVLLLAVAVTWRNFMLERRWAAVRKRTQELLEEAKARDPARPVLRGEPVPGNAWDDYELALAAAAGLTSDQAKLGSFVIRAKDADPVAAEAIVRRYPAALEHLRAGARRATGQYPYAWERKGSPTSPSFARVHNLRNLAVAAARLDAERGRTREAVELLLDTLQFARDVGHNAIFVPVAISSSIYTTSLDELKELVLAGKLTESDLGEVDRELEIVDRNSPRLGPMLLNERLITAMSWKGRFEDLQLVVSAQPVPGWRHGFSLSCMVLQALELQDHWAQKVAAAAELSWSAEQAMVGEFERAVNLLRNPIVEVFSGGGWGHMGRHRRAQVRLLRAAVHWKRTGAIPDLDDPFGDKLKHVVKDGKLRAWSVGRDGVDDGGEGEWKPAGKKDLVLEVER